MDITTGETETKDTIADDRQPQNQAIKQSGNYFDWRSLLFTDGMIALGLALVALVPRVILATQLDLVTDEGTYIEAGKEDLALLAHFRIIANGWNYNYEHPPVAKLLIGLFIYLNAHLGHLLNELLAARIPSIVFGTLLVVAVYWLGRAPFGRVVALLAALCLAVSPWLVYFSALAYLDMTMTTLITIAYFLLWSAIRQPRLYLLSAVLVSLGAASKYTAVLIIPGMVLFIAYYYVLLRPRLPAEQRPPFQWLWWIAAVAISPITFLIADPAIWPRPLDLLIRSFRFEWQHSVEGHLTFLAGQYSLHVPHWSIFYMIFAKMSVFVTIPAACFLLFALVQLCRFHLRKATLPVTEVASIAFLFFWLASVLGMFSLLNIVVGTHYYLPLAAPIALAGAFAWVTLFGYRRGAVLQGPPRGATAAHVAAGPPQGSTTAYTPARAPTRHATRVNLRAAAVLALLAVVMVGPHLVGLTTVYAAEGYTSEAFNGENNAMQVAYPAYREAGLWLLAHTHGPGRVGLAAIIGTLVGDSTQGPYDVSWYTYNHDLQGRLRFIEAPVPESHSFPYDYLVWPMHLVQRGYTIPQPWRSHIVHIIMGGNTTYCFIMARDPSTISP
jgi:4-amino-4-deoxy-L-arabinose transferase-like glycosyltransferase